VAFRAADCPPDVRRFVVERSVVGRSVAGHSAAGFAEFPDAYCSADEEHFLFGHLPPVVEDAAPRSAAAEQHSDVSPAVEPHSPGLRVAVVFPDLAA
jgi:hypothetical protein